MTTWGAVFQAHIHRRFGDGAQQKAAMELRKCANGVGPLAKVSPSAVSYWCRGTSIPRLATRQQIELWSGGDVPAEPKDAPLADASSGDVTETATKSDRYRVANGDELPADEKPTTPSLARTGEG